MTQSDPMTTALRHHADQELEPGLRLPRLIQEMCVFGAVVGIQLPAIVKSKYPVLRAADATAVLNPLHLLRLPVTLQMLHSAVLGLVTRLLTSAARRGVARVEGIPTWATADKIGSWSSQRRQT